MGYYRSGKAIYFKNDPQLNGILIADAEDEEKADFLLNRILTHSSNFIKDAIVTCSPAFHADRVSLAEFRGRVNGAIDALNKLDQVKKSLFYGRDNNLISEGQRDVAELPARVHSDSSVANDIIHSILGFATEAGELLELLKRTVNGEPFDWVNAQEELGDAAWYAAILANRGDFDFEDYEQRIIKKLRQRYADKFSAAEANERNLQAERAILEDGQAPLETIVEPPQSETITHMRDEGDLLAGGEPPLIVPSQPASGPEAVKEAEARSDAAFNAINNVGSDSEDAPVTGGTNDSELSKSPAERKRPFPDEHLAHQPVRSEDLESDE